jgi:hypothetical protein
MTSNQKLKREVTMSEEIIYPDHQEVTWLLLHMQYREKN